MFHYEKQRLCFHDFQLLIDQFFGGGIHNENYILRYSPEGCYATCDPSAFF